MIKKFLWIILILLLTFVSLAQNWDEPESLSTEDLINNPSKAKEVWNSLEEWQKESVFIKDLKEFSDKFIEEKNLKSLGGNLDNCRYNGYYLINGNIKVSVPSLEGCDVIALDEGGFRITKQEEFIINNNIYKGSIELNNDNSITLLKDSYMINNNIKVVAKNNDVNVFLNKETELIKGKIFSSGNVYIKNDKVMLQGNGIRLEYNDLIEETLSNDAQIEIRFDKDFYINKFSGDSITNLGKVLKFENGKIFLDRDTINNLNKANAKIIFENKEIKIKEKGDIIIPHGKFEVVIRNDKEARQSLEYYKLKLNEDAKKIIKDPIYLKIYYDEKGKPFKITIEPKIESRRKYSTGIFGMRGKIVGGFADMIIKKSKGLIPKTFKKDLDSLMLTEKGNAKINLDVQLFKDGRIVSTNLNNNAQRITQIKPENFLKIVKEIELVPIEFKSPIFGLMSFLEFFKKYFFFSLLYFTIL